MEFDKDHQIVLKLTKAKKGVLFILDNDYKAGATFMAPASLINALVNGSMENGLMFANYMGTNEASQFKKKVAPIDMFDSSKITRTGEANEMSDAAQKERRNSKQQISDDW